MTIRPTKNGMDVIVVRRWSVKMLILSRQPQAREGQVQDVNE